MKCKTAIMVIFLLLACNASALAGCCNPCCSPCTCEHRDDFGKAYRLAMAGQILNPDAETNLEPVEGINGRAAAYIMQKYVDSFKPMPAASTGGLTSFAVTQNPGGSAH